MKLWYTGEAGQVQTQVAHLVNTSLDTLDIGIFLKDWKYDSLGNTEILPAGSTRLSCTDWIRLSVDTRFRLAPGEDKQIPLSIQAPAAKGEARKGDPGKGGAGADGPGKRPPDAPVHTAMLLFEQMNPVNARDSRGMGIRIALQIGVKLYYSFSEATDAEVEIRSFRQTDSGRAVQMTLANTGNRLVDGAVKCALVNKQNGKTDTLREAAFYTLPGDTRVISFPVPGNLPRGHYLVTGLVDSDALDDVQAAELDAGWGDK